MRKKQMLILIDKLLWLFILLLPVFAYFLSPLAYSIGGGTESAITMPTFADYLSQFGIDNDNVVFQALKDFFGENGIIKFFADDSALLVYFSYFVSVELVHLVIDFILFIPRLAHKYMSCMTRENE